jgi:hypothetical protein
MKCKICGSECPPGAKICRDCAAARKRAFAATVTQPLLATAGVPSVSAPRFAPKPANRPRPSSLLAVVHDASRPEAQQAALPLNVVPKSLGVHWLLIGVAIATTIVVLAVKVLSSASHATEDATATVPAMTAPAMAPAPPLAPVSADAHPAPEASAPVKASEVAVAKRVPERASRKAAPRTEPIKPATASPAAPEPAPVARAPAPPPRPVEAPRADPWQAMNEGLSRCAGEDLFSRGACEQRLRLQYCPNYWGMVPQCPIGPNTDHGQ